MIFTRSSSTPGFGKGRLTWLALVVASGVCAGLVSCQPVATSGPFSVAAPTNTVKVVMPLGDSITDGFSTPGGYRIRLWRLLVGRDHDPLSFVGSLSNGPSSLADHNHEGHNGWTIRQLRANIDTWMATSKPDAVLLNIGDNDILFDDNPSGAPGRLKDLVVRICEDRPGVRVLLSNLVGAVGYESQDAAFNSKVPGIASAVRAAGCNVTFVDLHRAVPQAYLSDDGDHPSSAGYDKMADAWYAALAPMMARS